MPLWERVCSQPLRWMGASAALAVGAAVLGWYSSGGIAHRYPASRGEWCWFAVTLLFAFLGSICPFKVIWAEEKGSVRIGHTVSLDVFIASRAVLAISRFVILARLVWNWEIAVSAYMSFAGGVVLHVINRKGRHRKEKASKEIEVAQKVSEKAVLKAVQLSNERRGRFLSIAAEELFDAVSEANSRAPDTPSTSKADDRIGNRGAKEC